MSLGQRQQTGSATALRRRRIFLTLTLPSLSRTARLRFVPAALALTVWLDGGLGRPVLSPSSSSSSSYTSSVSSYSVDSPRSLRSIS